MRIPILASGRDQYGRPLGRVACGRPRRRLSWRRLGLAAAALVLLFAGAYQWRETIVVGGSALSRRIIGEQNTMRLETAYFGVLDLTHRVEYRVFGSGGGNPESGSVRRRVALRPAPVLSARSAGSLATERRRARVAPAAVRPLGPPARVPPLYPHAAASDEGVWQPLQLAGRGAYLAQHPIYTTFVRPDPSRPYATVTLVAFDSSAVRLHLVAGTSEPGYAYGAAGTGRIPQSVVRSGALLAAFNGGFKWQDGRYGMVEDGRTVAPLQPGFATLATYRDGSIRIGTWGTEITSSPSLVSLRQNALMLIDHGQISPEINRGGHTWGFVWYTSRKFYTTRSAVAFLADGRFVYVAGYSVTAKTLALALKQAGVTRAMQLDINSPYTQMALYELRGGVHGFDLTRWMARCPDYFLRTRQRDFAYLTVGKWGRQAAAARPSGSQGRGGSSLSGPASAVSPRPAPPRRAAPRAARSR